MCQLKRWCLGALGGLGGGPWWSFVAPGGALGGRGWPFGGLSVVLGGSFADPGGPLFGCLPTQNPVLMMHSEEQIRNETKTYIKMKLESTPNAKDY